MSMIAYFIPGKVFRSAVIIGITLATLSLFSGCRNIITVSNGETLLKVELSKDGKIEGISVNDVKIKGNFNAMTLLDDCDIMLISSDVDANGRFEFIKAARNRKTGDSCTIREYFCAAENSIRWDMEIDGEKKPWSVPIVSEIKYPVNENVKYWTAWGRPQVEIDGIADRLLRKQLKLMSDTANDWLNPLIPVPFTNAIYFYGAPYVTYERPEIAFHTDDPPHMSRKYNGALISIPVISIVDKNLNAGLSFVISPEDYTQDLTLETTENGEIRFSRYYHRIVQKNKILFSMDIVAHKPDWRCGLDWMSARYPEYFEPANKIAKGMHGTGAYSTHDVAFDVNKMKAMAFSVNWKASFDFPYMGMFLPPVSSNTRWDSFGGWKTSTAEMQGYSKKMKEMGFHVLNYFNVTEFGTKVVYPAPPVSTREGEEWKNSNDYMYKYLEGAILHVPEGMMNIGNAYSRTKHGGPFYTWEDGIAMDCGNKEYSDFLLEQAQRHLDMIPDSYGFCIDRMDWLRLFNERTDDGKSWFDGKPVGSLVISWQQFMAKFAPLVHDNNKVIFVNNHTKRLDLLKNTDGFFDEFTYAEAPLNTTAFTAIKKPFCGWATWSGDIKIDGPDNFFQKYLYLGAFPMCPFPGNDHSIGPDDWADQQYLDYGPLLNMMKGREWVLTENPVIVDGASAKANMFTIPDGYIVPVVFGEDAEVTIRIALPAADPGLKVLVQYPGEKISRENDTQRMEEGRLVLTVPLKRGCALVKLIKTRQV
jgi:hypothetical protein